MVAVAVGEAKEATVPAVGRWPARLALAATLAPFAVAVVVLVAVVRGDYHPWSDWALAELRTRDLGRHPVELGPFSRDNWFHPGPALFYVLALPYRLTGGASIGILLGALLVNATALGGMALVARRLGGRPALFATLLCGGLLLRALGPDFARDPWNPTITVLPYGLTLFLAWAMTCGKTWALPLAAAVASFAAQTHVGYAVLALPLLAWGALWLTALALRTRHPRERPVTTPVAAGALARAAALTALVLAAMWAPPVLQELHNEPGNLTAIWRYLVDTDLPGRSVVDGLRILAPQLGLPPEWIAGPRPQTLTAEPGVLYLGAPVPWLLLPFALAAAVVVRRAGPRARRLLATLGLAAALGVVSVARTPGLAHAYRMQWAPVLGMAAGVLTLWAAWLAVGPRLARLGPPAGRIAGWAPGLALAGVVLVAAVNAVEAAGAGVPDQGAPEPSPTVPSDALGALVPAIDAALPPGDGPVVVLPSSSWASGHAVNGIVLGLEREGVDARVTADQFHLGAHRLHHGGPTRAEVVVAVDQDIDALRADPTLTPVAQWGRVPAPRPPGDITAEVERLLTGGTIDQLQSYVRATAARSGSLRRPFAVDAFAAFLRTTP